MNVPLTPDFLVKEKKKIWVLKVIVIFQKITGFTGHVP